MVYVGFSATQCFRGPLENNGDFPTPHSVASWPAVSHNDRICFIEIANTTNQDLIYVLGPSLYLKELLFYFTHQETKSWKSSVRDLSVEYHSKYFLISKPILLSFVSIALSLVGLLPAPDPVYS